MCEARHAGGVVKCLCSDQPRCLVSLELHDDQVPIAVDAKEVDRTARRLDLVPDHEQLGIEDRDVALQPLLEPRLEVEPRAGNLAQRFVRADCPEANLVAHGSSLRPSRSQTSTSMTTRQWSLGPH
jgi:hypothetical protein